MRNDGATVTPAAWPGGVRVMVTAFLVMIGVGYLFAMANIYQSYEMADGKPGMTLDDVRAAYSGLTVKKTEETVIPSRMLTMLRTSMREYVDDERDFNVLESWLKAGGEKATMTEGENRRTPERVMILNCLRCHAEESGTEISKKAPFGPDEFTVDYEMIKPLVAAEIDVGSDVVHIPPQLSVPRLILLTHAHMLAIPIFTLIVGGLFACARFPKRPGAWLTPLPMLAVAFDFAGWWAARAIPGGIYLVVAAGGVFGVVFGFQLVVVLVDLWRPLRNRG